MRVLCMWLIACSNCIHTSANWYKILSSDTCALYMYVYMHTHSQTRAHARAHSYVCIYTYMYINMYTYTCIYVCKFIYIQTHIYKSDLLSRERTDATQYLRKRFAVMVDRDAQMLICIYSWIHIYIYIRTYI